MASRMGRLPLAEKLADIALEKASLTELLPTADTERNEVPSFPSKPREDDDLTERRQTIRLSAYQPTARTASSSPPPRKLSRIAAKPESDEENEESRVPRAVKHQRQRDKRGNAQAGVRIGEGIKGESEGQEQQQKLIAVEQHQKPSNARLRDARRDATGSTAHGQSATPLCCFVSRRELRAYLAAAWIAFQSNFFASAMRSGWRPRRMIGSAPRRLAAMTPHKPTAPSPMTAVALPRRTLALTAA